MSRERKRQQSSDRVDQVPLSEVDQHVLELIRRGDRDTWNDFVASYHGRLISFTSRQVDQMATAEDIVQETFVSFLKTLNRFRRECDVETFLFQILRRRIVDYYRAHGRCFHIQACGALEETAKDSLPSLQGMRSSSDPVSDLERNELSEEYETALSQAIRTVCGRLREKEKFRDLKIAEGTLYASLSNSEMAALLSCKPNEVAVVKHRLIARLANTVKERAADQSWPGGLPEQLLTTVWNELRPSCPKRTTLGKYLLGLLPENWHSYVCFHVEQLQCQFCLANTDEFTVGELNRDNDISDRIFHSTIGFLKST